MPLQVGEGGGAPRESHALQRGDDEARQYVRVGQLGHAERRVTESSHLHRNRITAAFHSCTYSRVRVVCMCGHAGNVYTRVSLCRLSSPRCVACSARACVHACVSACVRVWVRLQSTRWWAQSKAGYSRSKYVCVRVCVGNCRQSIKISLVAQIIGIACVLPKPFRRKI